MLLHIALIYVSRSGALQSGQPLQPARVFGSAQPAFREILSFPLGIHLSAARHDTVNLGCPKVKEEKNTHLHIFPINFQFLTIQTQNLTCSLRP